VLSDCSNAHSRSRDPSPSRSSSLGGPNLCVGASSSIGSISVVTLDVARKPNEM